MRPIIAMSLEIDNNVIFGGLIFTAILTVAGLIGSLAVIKGWIREVAGVKKTSSTELVGQPLQVEMAKQFMTRDDHRAVCEHMERRVKNLEDHAKRSDERIETIQVEILKAGEDRAIKIHDRINDIDRKVAGLEERTTATNTTLAVQDKKLDAILERL